MIRAGESGFPSPREESNGQKGLTFPMPEGLVGWLVGRSVGWLVGWGAGPGLHQRRAAVDQADHPLLRDDAGTVTALKNKASRFPRPPGRVHFLLFWRGGPFWNQLPLKKMPDFLMWPMSIPVWKAFYLKL